LKKQLQEQAARAFDADIRRHTPDVREPEIGSYTPGSAI